MHSFIFCLCQAQAHTFVTADTVPPPHAPSPLNAPSFPFNMMTQASYQHQHSVFFNQLFLFVFLGGYAAKNS